MLAVFLTLAALGMAGVLSGRESGASSMASTKAQDILEAMLAAQPQGKATAASFVETTYGEYYANLSEKQRVSTPEIPDTDRVIIVEVTGTFPSAHRGPPGANTDADTITTVYDERTGEPIETGYSVAAPANPAASGAAIPPAPGLNDLSELGTPQPLDIP